MRDFPVGIEPLQFIAVLAVPNALIYNRDQTLPSSHTLNNVVDNFLTPRNMQLAMIIALNNRNSQYTLSMNNDLSHIHCLGGTRGGAILSDAPEDISLFPSKRNLVYNKNKTICKSSASTHNVVIELFKCPSVGQTTHPSSSSSSTAAGRLVLPLLQ